VLQKELYNGITNVAVWRVLRKRLRLKAYKLSIIQGVERWIVHSNICNSIAKLFLKHPVLEDTTFRKLDLFPSSGE
jgi:hypothetical protein